MFKFEIIVHSGDVCRKGDGSNADHVCLRAEDCDWTEDKKNDVCELDGSQTLVCCPKTRGRKSPVMKRTTEKKPSIADDSTCVHNIITSKSIRFSSGIMFQRVVIKYISVVV